MSSISDCPICYEAIHDTNCVTTECGHKFHTNCLLKNISFNGYKCPYCRETMIQTKNPNTSLFPSGYQEQDYDDDSLPELISDNSVDDIINHSSNEGLFSMIDNREPELYIDITSSNQSSSQIVEEGYNDETYLLDGMRWLFQMASNEVPDNDTPFADEFESWIQNIERNRIQQNEDVDRRMNLVLSKLKEIKSLSFDDVVKALLYQKDHYYISSGKAYNYNKKVHSTIDSVINRVGI
jgi:hypothetical protein